MLQMAKIPFNIVFEAFELLIIWIIFIYINSNYIYG